ncbi:death domain-containing protein CRADD [Parambassis ranga]|uniref:Death domain-containing protein CRADD n=1 Tax=Parambassis ranga TaxID=210632 RepID=A0A6P7HFJ3_9TELE|nr:death domain-containing protein CRADD-like [Parambassis ranga]
MEPAHMALLRRHRLHLSGQLLVNDDIVPFLYQEDILTKPQVEEIQALPTDTQRTLRLLDILPNRGPRAFDAFLRSLEHYSWVRDRLLLELQTEPEPGTSGVCRLPPAVLQRVPSDRELSRLAFRLGADWESVLMDLGLSAEALFRCRADQSLSVHGAALAGLVQWRRSEGRKATVDKLLQSLQVAGIHPSVLEEAVQ